MDASFSTPPAEVLATHGRFVRSLARDLVKDEHLAEDVVQETWLRFFRRPPRQPGATRVWMRSVVRRLAVDASRSRSRRAHREERAARPETLPATDAELAQAEVLRSVVGSVLALDEPYRTTVLLRYWRGWDARRIEAETGTPLATVRSRLQRAHERLRERLDREHGRESWSIAAVALATGKAADAVGVTVVAGAAKLLLGAIAAGALLFLGWRAIATPSPVRRDTKAESVAALGGRQSAGAEVAAPASGPGRSALDAAATGRVRVAGRVVDRAYPELGLVQGPAAGLTLSIRLKRAQYTFDALAEVEATTDADGRFELDLEDPGVRPLWAAVSAPADETRRRVWHAARIDDGGELEILRAAHGVLEGRIVGDDDRPVEGVEVRLESRSGDEARTAVSRADGVFRVEGLLPFQRVRVDAPGLALFPWNEPRPLEEGGWSPLVLRLAARAALRLTLTDDRGEPVPGVRVSVALDASESSVLGQEAFSSNDGTRSESTDATGTALVDGLWAGRKLAVTIQPGLDTLLARAARDERLVFETGGSQGAPIVLAAGEERVLAAHLVRVELAGRVLRGEHAGGGPVAGAGVQARDLGRDGEPRLMRVKTDDAGRFESDYLGLPLRGPLQLVASEESKDPSRLDDLGYAGPSPVEVAGPDAAVSTVDDLDPERLRALEIVLGSTFSIEGVLRDATGAPIEREGMGGSRIWAVPAGAGDHHVERPLASASGSLGAGGSFAIRGLADGVYDVLVSEEIRSFYTYESFLHRFPGIAAGARGVELRLPPREVVKIRMRVEGGAPESMVVLKARFFPDEPERAGFPPAPPVIRVSGASPWPERTSYGFTGIGGGRGESGSWSHGYDSIEGVTEHELPPLGPGWYAIGIHAAGADGEPGSYPQATPLMRFEPGEHEVVFELLPAATLRGRIVGGPRDEFLAVSLVDGSGRALPVATTEGYGRPATLVETAASGDFVLRQAPAGAFRLRAGLRAELERGQWRRELALTIVPGENPSVEIRY